MDYIKELDKLAGGTTRAEKPDAKDWKRLERELRVVLQADFKKLVGVLGSGWFGLNFMLSNPLGSGNQKLSMEKLVEYRDMLEFLEEQGVVSLFPKKRGLIVVGGMDRINLLLGPSSQNDDEYSLLYILDQDYEELHPFSGSVSKFIYELHRGEIREEWATGLRESVWNYPGIPSFRPILV